ncbi:Serine acetyltransferase [Dermatophilus congolensis]|uniref:Serine acetyltransferase n=1 Tax=Dermatophilus congolensis TaxID=1863 RepID=A0AA46BLQ7_9MICO|nr:serine acetyltransferase [Dermatophilus congolensis]STD04831.1 Serine acetyltransferase [Dermatophilus congolensis]
MAQQKTAAEPPQPLSADQPVHDPVRWCRAMLAADYPRNPYWTQRLTLFCLRAGRAWHRQPGLKAFLIRRVLQVLKFVWVEGFIGSEIPNQVWIGPGVRIPHALRGVMIHPSVTIGANVTLYHQTVLGVRDTREGPTLGDDIVVGAGAKILGPITVASGTSIGANAVLVSDTEPNTTWVGIPARPVTSRRDR